MLIVRIISFSWRIRIRQLKKCKNIFTSSRIQIFRKKFYQKFTFLLTSFTSKIFVIINFQCNINLHYYLNYIMTKLITRSVNESASVSRTMTFKIQSISTLFTIYTETPCMLGLRLYFQNAMSLIFETVEVGHRSVLRCIMTCTCSTSRYVRNFSEVKVFPQFA